ncbi:MAG: MFS transporter [Bradyrhizobiaceae bacterium]|nr:MFS transporter [Bradyrhizobiaceae bacterium]
MDESKRQVSKRQVGFINAAHFVDHYVILIFPTVVIGLETELQRSYGELIALSTACFVAFGLFSLPWGWAGDHWSRRKLMAIFFLGIAGALAAAAASPNMIVLAVALFVLGVFAAIYHPVGVPVLITHARDRGRDIARNGVYGNLGVAFAPGLTAAIAVALGWRATFALPALVCAAIGVAYLFMTDETHDKAAERARTAEVPLALYVAVGMFVALAVTSFAGGLVFNIVTVALPKIVDEKFAQDIPLALIGSVATFVLLFGGVAQLTVGRLVSIVQPHLLFVGVAFVQVIGLSWATVAEGPALLAALAIAIAAIYAQVTIADVVLARYTADSWRGRVYAVRFFLAFITSGAAIAIIAALHGRGGFFLVLALTAVCAAVFATAALAIALLAGKAESVARSAQPAE